jgi:hypothetical protein
VGGLMLPQGSDAVEAGLDPKGVRLGGEKLLGCSKRRASLIPNPAQLGYVTDAPPLKREAP